MCSSEKCSVHDVWTKYLHMAGKSEDKQVPSNVEELGFPVLQQSKLWNLNNNGLKADLDTD